MTIWHGFARVPPLRHTCCKCVNRHAADAAASPAEKTLLTIKKTTERGQKDSLPTKFFTSTVVYEVASVVGGTFVGTMDGLIGVAPVEEKTEHAFPIVKKIKRDHRVVRAGRFCWFHGIKMPRTTACMAEIDEDGTLVLELQATRAVR